MRYLIGFVEIVLISLIFLVGESCASYLEHYYLASATFFESDELRRKN